MLQTVQLPQTFPHAPQFWPSFVVLTHTPEQQVAPLRQRTPQAPQLATLLAGLTQAPAQQIPAPAVVVQGVGGVAGVGTQLPLTQTVQAPHTLPHAPQL